VKNINWMVLMVLTVLAAMVQADEQAELTATLNNFHQAAAHADMDSYFAAITDDVDFLGTDGSERWQGQDFRDNAMVHDVVSDIAALDTPVQAAAESAGAAAGAPVASAITAEAAEVDDAIAEPSAATQPEAQQKRAGCARKRWKTNRKAGC
jgi:hypothetical protein